MNKVMGILGIMMLLMVSMVAAATNTSGQIQLTIQPIKEQMNSNVSTVNRTEFKATHSDIVKAVEEHSVLRNSTLTGLENARLRVTNEQAAQRIEANILKLQERDRIMINKLEGVNIAEGVNNTMIIEGKDGEAKLFNIIKVNRGVTFIVDANNTTARIGRPFDFLYKYDKEVEQVEVI